MRIVTWNVNSLRARMDRLLSFLAQHEPDVVCLQETKVAEDQFPHFDVQLAGYAVVEHSGGQWAGVALLVRDGHVVADPAYGLAGEPDPDEARWVEATVDGLRVCSVYVPNGRSPDDPAFASKLRFLEAMRDRMAALAATPTVVAGDLNIAPGDRDVHDPSRFAGGTHVHPQERARLAAMLDLGYVDAFRTLHPDDPGFTWWDYRGGAFPRDLGMRIDLVLASRPVAGDLVAARVDRDARRGERPSDHAPLAVDLAPRGHA